ncbi:hypothetical protein FB107DRAFT_270016 [Schizophyllum commune]
MSEVDYSPEAYVRYHQKQKRVADWVDSTSTHSQRFSNPPAPSVAGSSSSHRSGRAPSAVHVAHSRSGSVAPGPSRAGSATPSRSASVPPFLAPPPPTGFGPAPGYAGVPTQPGSGMYYAPPGSVVILPSGHSSPSVVNVPSQVPSPTSMPASPLSMGSSPPSMAGSAHAAIPRDLPGSVAPSLSHGSSSSRSSTHSSHRSSGHGSHRSHGSSRSQTYPPSSYPPPVIIPTSSLVDAPRGTRSSSSNKSKSRHGHKDYVQVPVTVPGFDVRGPTGEPIQVYQRYYPQYHLRR